MNIRTVVVLLAVGLVTVAAGAAEVFKWTDENGKVHYGESVPERYQRKATRIDTESSRPTDAQREQAASRAARDKAKAQSGVRDASEPARPEASSADTGCEAQKQRYQESQECFAPFRTANGGLKADAFEHCVEVAEPQC